MSGCTLCFKETAKNNKNQNFPSEMAFILETEDFNKLQNVIDATTGFLDIVDQELDHLEKMSKSDFILFMLKYDFKLSGKFYDEFEAKQAINDGLIECLVRKRVSNVGFNLRVSTENVGDKKVLLITTR